jgi:phage anti-repressor protein
MTNDTLSVEAISGFLESSDPFPIDFDQAWQWLGYSAKQKAKDRLISEFLDGFDFEVFNLKVENPNGGRPAEKIKISVDCLKCLGMMAGTQKGREVRQYFLGCERELKSDRQEEGQASLPVPEDISGELVSISNSILCAYQHIIVVRKIIRQDFPCESGVLATALDELMALSQVLTELHPDFPESIAGQNFWQRYLDR